MNATDLQKRQTRNIGLALLINIILNSIFIIRFDAVGAALASTLSTVVLSVLGIQMIKNTLDIDIRMQLQDIQHVVTPLIALTGSVAFLRVFEIYWVVQLVVGIAAYTFVFYHSNFGKRILKIMQKK